MKNLFCLLLSFAMVSFANAQWKKLSSGTTKNLNDTYFLNSNYGYAVGDSGAILKTTNGGANWTMQNSNVSAKLSSVFFTDTATGYVVGDSALLLKTSNGGLTWVKQALGIPATFSFNSIYFRNDSSAFITSNSFEGISNSNIMLRTTNKWLTWTVDTFGVGVTSSIHFSSRDTGYMAGNCIRKTTNGGKDWQSESFNNIKLNGVTHNLYDSKIVAAGDSGKIVYGTNTSKQFSIANTGTTEKLNYIIYDSYYHYYFVVGTNGSILRNRDSDPITNWTAFNSGVTCNLNSVSTIDQSNYANIIVGDSGTILKSTNFGANWTKINSGYVNNFYSFAGNTGPSDNGYIVGDSGIILRLNNNVVTRMHPSLTNNKLNYICYNGTYFTELGYYIVGEKGTIIKATNNFNTITKQYVDSTIDLYYIHFYNANATPTVSGFACGFDHARNESVILYTSNGGANWYKNYTGFTTKLIGGADQDQYIAGEAGTILFAPQENYPTSYNFKHWVHYNSLPFSQASSVFFPDNKNGFAGNRNSDLYKTTDGGNNWSLLTVSNINSVFFTDSLNGYASSYNGSIRKTSDAGVNWSTQATSTYDNLNRVFFPNESAGYAVGSNGTIIKTWSIKVNNAAICLGDSAILTASGEGINYTWSNGKTGSTIRVSPATSTTYIVTGYTADGMSDTAIAVVTVIQKPNVSATADKPIINPGDSAVLCASGGDFYKWNTGETTSCITVFPSASTTYTVIGENQCGLKDTALVVVTVRGTAVEEIKMENSKFLLYPSPANDKVTIESSQLLEGCVIVCNVSGQEIIRQQINDTKTELNISNLTAGIYFVKLITGNTIEVRKMIKE